MPSVAWDSENTARFAWFAVLWLCAVVGCYWFEGLPSLFFLPLLSGTIAGIVYFWLKLFFCREEFRRAMLVAGASLVPLLVVVPITIFSLLIAKEQARVQLFGAADGAERFAEIFGQEQLPSVSRIYAQGRGDRFSGHGRYRFQFQVEDLGAARELLSGVGFDEGAEWKSAPYLTRSPDEFPILWLPLASSDQLEPFHGPNDNRAWLDPVTYTVYMDVDRFP